MNCIDQYKLYPVGYVRSKSTYYDNEGRVIKIIDSGRCNLIVTSSRDSFAKLITDPTSPEYIIRYLALGRGHHAVGDPSIPVLPVLSDTALEDEKFRKNYTSASYPDARSVEFYTNVGVTEANSYGWYSEIGLFSDSLMFAINVPTAGTGAWVKDDHIEIDYWWRIVF